MEGAYHNRRQDLHLKVLLIRLAFSSSNENANQYQNGNEAPRAPYLKRQVLLLIMVWTFHFDIDLDIDWRN
jgi:hypothetical protein